MVRHCGISLFFWGPCLHVTAIEPEMWSGTQHIGAVWSSICSCLFHCWVALGACKNPAVWPRILLCIVSCLVPCFSCSIYRVIQSFRLSGSVDCYVHRWGRPGCQNVYLSTHTFLSDVDTLSIFIGGLVMIVVPFPSLGIIWVCPSRFVDQPAAVVELSAVSFFVCSIMSSCARARNTCRSPLKPSSRLGHRFVCFSEPTWTVGGLQWLELFSILSWDKLLTESLIQPLNRAWIIEIHTQRWITFCLYSRISSAFFMENYLILLHNLIKPLDDCMCSHFNLFYKSNFLLKLNE